jgi:two-component system, NtrC family, response regulator HydG
VATILIIDDNETIREGLAHTVRKMGHRPLVSARGEDGIGQLKAAGEVDFVITDLRMEGMDGVEVLRQVQKRDPDVPTMIITAFGTVETAVEAMKLGAFDFLTKPFAPEVVRLKVERALELCASRRARRRLEAHNDYLKDEAEGRYRFAELVGGSDNMERVFRTVEKVAPTDSSVFIAGESGTGKELVARACHNLSKRASGPFIKVNCGALTETLLESELFGHEKGAFTGAHQAKTGLLESAEGGTVFLDEIGELPAALQVKLLRVLEDRQVMRVGALRPRQIDVRFVAATNRDLEEEVARGGFREDLFYRVNGIAIVIPPLRERVGEIPQLARLFVAQAASAAGLPEPRLSDQALELLESYAWPGNIRELRNLMERAVLLSTDDLITDEHLPTEKMRTGGVARAAEQPLGAGRGASLRDDVDELERRRILDALDSCSGNQTRAARMLGISRNTLAARLEQFGIPRPRKR